MSLKESDLIVKRLIFDVSVKAGVASAISAAPILGVPPLKQIFSFIVDKISAIIYKELSRFVVFSIIDFKNQADLIQYEEAVKKLSNIMAVPPDHYDHGPYGEALKQKEIEKAKNEYKKKLMALIRFNNT